MDTTQKEEKKNLSVKTLQNLKKLVSGIVITTESQDFQEGSIETHNYILEQLTQIFNFLRRNVGDGEIYKVLTKQGDEKSYGQDFDVKKQVGDLSKVMSQLKSQLLGSPNAPGQSNIYSELSLMKSQASEQAKQLRSQLEDLPEIKQQLQGLDNLISSTFSMFEDSMAMQDEQSREIIQKLEDFDDKFFNRFAEFTSKFSTTTLPSPQDSQKLSCKARDIIPLEKDIEESKSTDCSSSSNSINEIQLKSNIQKFSNDAFQYLLNPQPEVLTNLNILKNTIEQSFMDLKYQHSSILQTQAFKMSQIVENMLQSICFEDTNEKQGVVQYFQDQMLKARPVSLDFSLLLFDCVYQSMISSANFKILSKQTSNVEEQNPLGLEEYSIKTFNFQKEEQKLLSEWLSKKDLQLSLLYRASRNGFTYDALHGACDNYEGPTIAILKSDYNKVFGVYRSVSWKDTSKDDQNEFFFSLSYKTKDLQVCAQTLYGLLALDNSVVQLMKFKGFRILNYCNLNHGSTCNLIVAGKMQQKRLLGPLMQSADNAAGKPNLFRIVEIEVYKLTNTM